MSDFLKGKTILEMKIADDDLSLLFRCEDGEHIARVDADCCSYTWIESVELPAKGFPAKVLEVVELDLPSEVYENGDYLQYYGLCIKTDKGDMVIDYRNESNGYYGGDLVFPDEDYHYGGVHGQAISNNKWVDIKDAG